MGTQRRNSQFAATLELAQWTPISPLKPCESD